MNENWANLLPPFLISSDKERLKKELGDFFKDNKESIYKNFYLTSKVDYFRQSDIFHSVPSIEWDNDDEQYYTANTPAMLISNSCDVDTKETRSVDKNILFAPLISFEVFIANLKEQWVEANKDEKIKSLVEQIKKQTITNLFYLPPDPITGKDYIVFLDMTWWHPSEQIQNRIANIDTEKFISLNTSAHYLYLIKTAFHFFRLPETVERTFS